MGWWSSKSDQSASADDLHASQAEYVHNLLETLARDAEPMALAKRDELLAAARLEHERDVAGFRFECARWGDFLNLSIARLGNPTEPKEHFFYVERPEQKYSTAINLRHANTVRLILGNLPDTEGELTYGYWLPHDKMDGCGTLGGTGFGNYLPPKGSHWEAAPNLPHIPYSRPLFEIRAPKVAEHNVIDLSASNYRIKFTTQNYTRAAHDDRIFFESLNATLFAPAGCGESVYRQVLTARETIAQGIEAGGGDSVAGSVHESPVPEGHAPAVTREGR